MVEDCALKNITDKYNQFFFINCIEENDGSRGTDVDFTGIIRNCAAAASSPAYAEDIELCYASYEGNGLHHDAAVKTDALVPAHPYVPYITSDGVHTEDLQNAVQGDLFLYVCSTYTGSERSIDCPEEAPVSTARLEVCFRDTTFLQ